MSYPPPLHQQGPVNIITVNGQYAGVLTILPFAPHPAPQTARSIRRILSWSTVCPCFCFFFLSFSAGTLSITLPLVWSTCAVSLVFVLGLFFILRNKNANPDYIKAEGDATFSTKPYTIAVGLGVAGLWTAVAVLIILELKNVIAMGNGTVIRTGWRSRDYGRSMVLGMCILSLVVDLAAFILQLFLCYRFFEERRSFGKPRGAGGLVTQG